MLNEEIDRNKSKVLIIATSLDLKSRLLRSGGAVDGHIPLGNFSAGHLAADLATRTVTLEGHAHLHIDQRGGRGWKL